MGSCIAYDVQPLLQHVEVAMSKRRQGKGGGNRLVHALDTRAT
jgi:hypothetical protein